MLTDFQSSSLTDTHTFNGPLSGTTQVSQYQKSKTNLDFTEVRDSECLQCFDAVGWAAGRASGL